MAKPSWQDPLGLETINILVRKIIPLWTNGLHMIQLKLISAILNGQNIICWLCLAWRGGLWSSHHHHCPPV